MLRNPFLSMPKVALGSGQFNLNPFCHFFVTRVGRDGNSLQTKNIFWRFEGNSNVFSEERMRQYDARFE